MVSSVFDPTVSIELLTQRYLWSVSRVDDNKKCSHRLQLSDKSRSSMLISITVKVPVSWDARRAGDQKAAAGKISPKSES